MTLEITLLGEVGARGAGTVGDRRVLGSTQARVAFALLTLERHSGVTREALADALWAGRLPPTWSSAVRSVVSRLRRFVRMLLPEADDPLTGQGGCYRLTLPAATRVDIEVAERATLDAQAAQLAGQADEARDLADRAARLLRRPFLADHEGEWLAGVRARLGELLVVALETASQASVARDDATAALAYANEAVRRGPLRETAHRCRIEAHAVAGNRSEALRAYHQLRHLLATELGIDPAPETEAVYLDLLGPGPISGRPAATSERREPVPFVGRSTELAALGEAWRRAAGGRRQLALVTGEAGIGKTRLVLEEARRASDDGGLVLMARCDPDAEVDRTPSDGLLVELLDAYLAGLPADERPTLNQRGWEELAAVLPSLDRPTTSSASPSRADSSRRAAAVVSVVRHASRDRPVLLVLDDLQWADRGTLRLLHHLVRRTTDSRLLVVTVGRGLGPGHNPLTHLVANLADGDDMHHIRVGPLPEAEVEALVARLAPRDGDQGAGQLPRLFAQTWGNPLLMVELLRSAAPQGQAQSSSVPERIRQVIGSAVATLGSPTIDLVRAAALGGSEAFDLDLAGSVAGLDRLAALDAMDGAVASGLVVADEDDGERPSYRFANQAVQRTVSNGLDPSRRRELHRRWADAIEDRWGRDPGDLKRHAAELARHRSAAAGPGGDARAAHWARVAADRADLDRAADEALRLRRRALEHLPPGDDELGALLTTELGLALVESDPTEAEARLLDGAVRARRGGRSDVMAQAALGLADLARSRPELGSEASALLAEAVAADQPMSWKSDLQARATARLVELDRSARIPEDRLTAACRTLLGSLHRLVAPEDAARRAALARDLTVVAAGLDEPHARVLAGHHRAMAAALQADWPGVRLGVDALRAASGGTESGLASLLLAEHAAAVAAIEGGSSPPPSSPTRPDISRDRLTTGLWPAAGTLVARQQTVIRWLQGREPASSGPDDADPLDRAEQPLRALAAGDRGSARLVARDLAGELTRSPRSDGWLHAAGLLALAAAELGDPTLVDEGRHLLEPYHELPCGVGYRCFAGPASLHLGRLAAMGGDWIDAERHLTTASVELAALGARPWLALTQATLADVLEARGRASDLAWISALRHEATGAARQLSLNLLRLWS